MSPQSTSNIELPSITLCTSWQRDPKYVNAYFDHSINDHKNSFNNTIHSCRLLAKNGSMIDCDQILSIEHRMDARHNCFTLSDIDSNGSGFYEDGHMASGRNMMVIELVSNCICIRSILSRKL